MFSGERVIRHAFAEFTTDSLGETREKRFSGDLVLPGAAFDPGGTGEPATAGDTPVESSPRLLFAGQSVQSSAHDEWTARGRRYQQDGDGQIWISPFTGRTGGTVIPLKRRAG